MNHSNGFTLGKRASTKKYITKEEGDRNHFPQNNNDVLCDASSQHLSNFPLPASGILQRSRSQLGHNTKGKGAGKSVSFMMGELDLIPEVPPLPTSTIPEVATRMVHLSLQQLFLLNMVVCGLEFCASAAFTYIPPMLLKSGIEEEHMSLILGIGPLLGFFFVPIIGHWSDTCRSRYGRRRPFIFVLGLLLVFSLVIIPYGELISNYLFGKSAASKTVGMGMLIVGSVLLDFTSQAGLTPCEALLSDASRNTNQQDRAFTVYSFMVSVGGCIGYLITALDWSTSSIGFYFGGQEQSAFSLLIVLFSLAMFTTLLVAEEKPVISVRQLSSEQKSNEQASAENVKKINQALDQIHQAIVRDKDRFVLGPSDPGYETSSNQSVSDEYQNSAGNGKAAISNLEDLTEAEVPLLLPTPSIGNRKSENSSISTVNRSSFISCSIFRRRQCHIPLTRWTFTTCEGLCHLVCLHVIKGLPKSFKTLINVPAVLKRLALANYCSWTAVMGFNLFFTDFVGQAVYQGNPNADENSPERSLYDEGVRMASWGLLLHCITSAIYAACIDRLVTRYSMKTLYCVGMLSFSIAMAVMVFVRNVYVVIMMAACTGFAYATVTTIPFMLVQNYHTHKEIYFYDRSGGRGIGSDMATLDSAYFLSQVMLSAFMGYIVYYSGTVLAYVVIAGSMGVVASMCSLRVIYSRQEMSTYIRTNRVEPPGYVEI